MDGGEALLAPPVEEMPGDSPTSTDNPYVQVTAAFRLIIASR
jgi:hypothetical protein